MASPVVAVVAAEVVAEEPGSRVAVLPFGLMRYLVGAIAILMASFAVPASAYESPSFPQYTGPEFQALYEYAVANTLPNLDHPAGTSPITGKLETDELIWTLAFERGYVMRPTAAGDLSSASGVLMQPQAAEAWSELRKVARAAGMRFIVSSAYRSEASQRSHFLSKLEGTSESAILTALTWYSLPGTSKHHSGYALDFRYSDGTFGDFRSTKDYQWLQEENFLILKQHGFVPSYPDDGASQGPNPEPWEFVWIGEGLIRCGLPQGSGMAASGPEAAIIDDLERCPGGAGPIEVPRWLDAQ